MRTSLYVGAALATALAACAWPSRPAGPPTTVAARDMGAFATLAVARLPIAEATAGSEAAGMPAARAIDGNPATAWASGQRPGITWLRLRFEAPHAFRRLRLRTGPMAPGTTFKVDVSMDGVAWEPASGRLRIDSDAMEAREIFSRGRFLRVRFFNRVEAPVEQFKVHELEVLGEPIGSQRGPAGPEPLRVPLPAPTGSAPAFSLAAISADARRQYPDWLAIPPRNVSLTDGRLRFDTALGNRGPGYLQIRNVLSGAQKGTAIQELLDARFRIIHRHPASRIVYYANHGHYHVEGIATHELRRGGPAGPLVIGTTKTSFCVEDSYRFRDNGLASRYPDCTMTLMGITPGFADVYSASLPEQQLDVRALPAGTYTLVVRVDPGMRFLDAARGNNVAWTQLTLDPKTGALRVLKTS